MDRLFNYVSVVCGLAGGVLVYLTGGFDVLLSALVIMTVLDYITGVLKAFLEKSLSSEIGSKGIIKKVMLYIVVFCSVVLGRLLSVPLREIVITFFVANEGMSILENVGEYLPLPLALKNALIQLNEDSRA